MTQAAEKENLDSFPSRAEWDFDLGGCPKDELKHCCFYEYALESAAIKNAVLAHRENPRCFMKPNDEIGNLAAERWFGLPSRVLVDHPEFPQKHWLEIDPGLRKQKVEKLPPFSKIDWTRSPPKYQGPENHHFTQLHAQKLKWEFIASGIEELRSSFLDAKANKTLRDWPTKLGSYLDAAEITRWSEKTSMLCGDELDLAANKLLKLCKKIVEAGRRDKQELVVYEIDWNLRPDELKAMFGQWAESNRPHKYRPRSGGHPPKDVDLLKALGARRVMEFFRANWSKLPSNYRRTWTLEGAVKDFTEKERRKADRPSVPLYKTRKGWNDAVESAARHQNNFP